MTITAEELAVKLSAQTGELKAGMESATSTVASSVGELKAAIGGMSAEVRSSMERMTAGIRAQVEQSRAQLGVLKDSAVAAGDGFKRIGELFLVSMGVGKLVEMTAHTAAFADELDKARQKTGMTTDALQRLKFAGDLTNVGFAAMSTGLRVLAQRMLLAQENSKETVDAFEAVGISGDEIKNLSLQQVLEKIADKFHDTADGAAKLGLAQQLLGRRGSELIPVLDLGSAGMRKLGDEAERMGLVLSEKDQEQLRQLDTQLKLMHQSSTVLERQLATAMTPALTGIAAAFNEDVKAGGFLKGMLADLSSGVKMLTEVGVALAATFEAAGKIIGATMAAAMAALHGNFAGAKQILEDVKHAVDSIGVDANRVIGRIESGVPAATSQVAAILDGGTGGGKLSLPGNAGGRSNAAEENATREKRLRDEDTRGWVKAIDEQKRAYEDGLRQQAKDTEKFYADKQKAAEKAAKEQERLRKQELAAEQRQLKALLDPVASAFDQSIRGIIQGTTTLKQAEDNLIQSIALSFIDAAVKSAEKWVISEAIKTAATQAGVAARVAAQQAGDQAGLVSMVGTVVKSIMADAAKAFSGVWAALSGIPYVGPALAAASAPAAYATVASVAGSVASAAGGWWEVPGDQMAQIHKKEMVLPAEHAEALRAMTAGGGRGGGAVHLHVHATDADSVRRLFLDNKGALADALRSAQRAGHFGGSGAGRV
jgi:hypothetical protein